MVRTFSPHGLLVSLAVLLLTLATGCGGGALAQPFESLKSAPITVYRLQNFEPPPAQAQTTGTVAIPPQIMQWATAAASALPPGIIPPGILPGSQPAAAAAPDAARFHDFRILGWVPLNDEKMRTEVLDILGHEKNFATPTENCMYAEFGVSITQQGQPPADLLVSLSCHQVRTFGFAWPYGNSTGVTGEAEKRVLEVMKKAFGGG
jgi:hypothetical protein